MRLSRLLISLCLACGCGLPMQAKVVDPAQAKALAAKYVNLGSNKLKVFKAQGEAKQASTPDFYVFNDSQGKGFVLIAGDDCINPVLGYSDSGNFDIDNLPPALEAWLKGISEGIAQKRAANNGVAKSANYQEGTSEPKVVVAPLVTARWSQAEPYYNMTPTLNGEQCVTGCVATGMAQVIHHYKWPEHGYGSIKYDTPNVDQKTVDVDFTKSTYDWANMLDKYETSATTGLPEWNEAQGNAVALLMKDLGAALRMVYHPHGSAANNADILSAATYHFGYTVEHHYKDNHTMAEWMKLIKSYLDSGDPLVYGGTSSNGGGGHCYVVDGYNSDNYLHVNWGWAGKDDGYYSFHDFGPQNYNQEMAFFKLTPNKSGIIEWDAQLPIEINNRASNLYLNNEKVNAYSFTTDVDKLNADVELALGVGTGQGFKGKLTLGYTPNKSSEFTPLKTLDNVEINNTKRTLAKFHFESSDISSWADGKYWLILHSLKEASGLSVHGAKETTAIADEYNKLALIKKDGKVSIGFGDLNKPLLTLNGKLNFDKQEYDITDVAKISASISNNTEYDYNYPLFLRIVDGDNHETSAELDQTTLYGGENGSADQNVPIYASNGFTEGTYKVTLAEKIGGKLVDLQNSEPLTIKVNRNDGKIPVLESPNLEIIVGSESLTDYDNLVFDINDFITVKGDLRSLPLSYTPQYINMKYCAYIRINDEDERGAGDITDIEDETPFYTSHLFPEEEKGMTGEIAVTYTPMDDTQMHYALYKGKEISFPFKVIDKSAGINDVTTSGKAKETMRFDAEGRRITTPTKGINIIKMSDGSVRKAIIK